MCESSAFLIAKNIASLLISAYKIFLIDQQKSTESDSSKVQKHVTFSENKDETIELKGNKSEAPRNFFMMETTATQEPKANFMVGGDIEEIEEKDVFPPQQISRQLSDAALIDKRRRLR